VLFVVDQTLLVVLLIVRDEYHQIHRHDHRLNSSLNSRHNNVSNNSSNNNNSSKREEQEVDQTYHLIVLPNFGNCDSCRVMRRLQLVAPVRICCWFLIFVVFFGCHFFIIILCALLGVFFYILIFICTVFVVCFLLL
jgi:hypothetical protein